MHCVVIVVVVVMNEDRQIDVFTWPSSSSSPLGDPCANCQCQYAFVYSGTSGDGLLGLISPRNSRVASAPVSQTSRPDP